MNSMGLEEAAKFLHMHPQTLRRKAKKGEIPGAKPGKPWIFIDTHLADFLASHYAQPRQALQGEEVKCHPTNQKAPISGMLDSQRQAENALDEALGLRTKRKPASTKTRLKPKLGDRTS